MTARLPQPGGDDGNWGNILNGFLDVSHNSDGTLLPAAITNAGGYVKPGAGIPSTDMTSTVQSALTSAGTALQPGVTVGGDLSGTLPNPTVSKIRGTSIVTPPGGSTQFLRGDGAWGVPAGSGVPISNVRSISGVSAVTANAWDTLEIDASSQAVTVTLPANTAGTIVTLKKIDNSTNTITVSGTIDSSVNPTLKYQWGTLYLIGDGTNWKRIDRHTLTSLVDTSVTSVAQGDGLSWNGTSWVNSQYVLNVKLFGAKGDNSNDDTSAIQGAITAAASSGVPVFFPPGEYRISSSLTVSEGTVLQGVNSGGYGIVIPETQVSTIAAMASMNAALITGPQGAAHVRIRDLHLDCNANNNTSTHGIYLNDVGTPEEAQWHVENCFVEAASLYGIYIGSGRRAVKIRYSDIMYCSTGVRFNGSDGEINTCIVGSHAVDGIGAGAPVTRILNCDIFGNTNNGINVYASINQVLISGNGIDRNGTNGIYMSASSSTVSIINNDFHSNSQTTNGGAHHINVQTDMIGSANILGNIFGADAGMSHAAGYAIYMNTAVGTTNSYGNVFMTSSTNLGLTNAPTQIGIIAFRGAYSSTATYIQGDVVTSGGQTYICQAWNVTNNTPVSGATWTLLSSGVNTTSNTFTGNQTAPVFIASGLTGATAASRYAGATANGAPTTGTFIVGDFIIDHLGKVWVCTVAGTPGTWVAGSGGVTVDNSTVPQADAIVGAAGNSSNATAQNHAHPRTYWAPSDHSLISWSMDVTVATANSVIATAGTLYLVRVHVPVAASATNILVAVTSATATLTSGQCFASLYTAAGALVGSTADQSTNWTTSGLKTMALSGGPFALAAGDYYISFYANGSVLPNFARGNNQIGGTFLNAGLASNLRFATANTGLTTAPPGTLGAQTASNFSWWLAIS